MSSCLASAARMEHAANDAPSPWCDSASAVALNCIREEAHANFIDGGQGGFATSMHAEISMGMETAGPSWSFCAEVSRTAGPVRELCTPMIPGGITRPRVRLLLDGPVRPALDSHGSGQPPCTYL